MKKITFVNVEWKYENERFERFSMDTEKLPEFREYVSRNLGKIIQEEEIDEAELGFNPQSKRHQSDLTDTEKMILS